jgi:uncharacterized protein YoxC
MNTPVKDTSIDEIENLLRVKQHNIQDMEKLTKNSREKLKKINERIDKQHEILLNLITEIGFISQTVDNFNDYNEEDDQNFSKDVKNVLQELRKIRNSLADIIRNE